MNNGVGNDVSVEVALALVRDALNLEFADSDVGQPPLGGVCSDPTAQQAAVPHLIRHRVVGLVLKHAEDLGLSDQVRARLRQRWQREAQRTLAVQQAAITLADGLSNAGLPCLAYKGVALAAMTTDDATMRGASDLDLLVAPSDVPEVYAWLLNEGASFVAGFCPPPTSDLWDYARRLNCEMPLIWKGVDIDLHWRIDQLPQIVSIPFAELWARRSVVSIGGKDLATLGPTDAMLVTCAHGTKEHWRHWRWVVDVVRQARTIGNWDDLQQCARESGCGPSLAIGLAVHELLMPLPAGAPHPGSKARGLANRAWIRARNDAAPFGEVALAGQLNRLQWTAQTLPSMSAAGSLTIRQGWKTLDMAEFPMPRTMAWSYPLVRPYLWGRRLRTGRYGPAALKPEGGVGVTSDGS